MAAMRRMMSCSSWPGLGAEYEVKAWLMGEMHVSSSLATKWVQKRTVLRTSMPYEQAMQWKRELEALGATVEVG